MQIPIEVSHTKPLKFRWIKRTDTINGPTTVTYNSAVHPSLEGALLALINLAKKQEKECDTLHREIDKLKAELKFVTESLTKKNDKVEVLVPVQSTPSITPPLKKSK